MLSQKKGTHTIITLLEETKKTSPPAKHVLFDSWFSSPNILHSVEVKVVKEDAALPKKIVYVRNHKKHKEYLCLISTDVNLG